MNLTPGSCPLVFIVILNWNNAPDTVACLESVLRLDFGNFDVIIVDNASSDDSVERIRAAYPHIDLVVSSANLGYAGGNNLGITQALKLGADYVCILNNDTVVDSAMLSELVQEAESDAAVGIVAPKVYCYSDPNRIWSAGGRIDWRTGLTVRLGSGEIDDPSALRGPVDVDFATGCALCVKRQVFERIGLFDPNFFMYYEETDWCVRAKRAGFRIVYVPGAKLWHKALAATVADSPATTYYMQRNVFLFLRKSLPLGPAIAAVIWQLGYQFRSIASVALKRRRRHWRTELDARIMAILHFALGRYGQRTVHNDRLVSRSRQ